MRYYIKALRKGCPYPLREPSVLPYWFNLTVMVRRDLFWILFIYFEYLLAVVIAEEVIPMAFFFILYYYNIH